MLEITVPTPSNKPTHLLRIINLERIEVFANLQDGWDGDRAPKPLDIAIENAKQYILKHQITKFEVGADASGGLVLDVGELEVYCQNNGRIICSQPRKGQLSLITEITL